MRKTNLVLSTLPLLLAATSALAADQIKPGLWEMTMKSDAMKQMPKIPPEQMEQMRKMGINVPQKQDGGMVTKMCITKEMAARDTPPSGPEQSGCRVQNQKRQGNSYSMELVCDNAQMKGTAFIKGSYSGNERFDSTYDFKGTAHGRPANQHQESSGRWLGADCGNVRPMGATRKN